MTYLALRDAFSRAFNTTAQNINSYKKSLYSAARHAQHKFYYYAGLCSNAQNLEIKRQARSHTL